MKVLRQALAAVQARFLALDLQGKITVTLVLGSLLIGGTVAVPGFLLARHQMSHSANALLDAEAQRERREIELRIAAAVSVAESLASNTITANALADSMGRETYLVPLLRNQKLPIPGASLLLTDYRGRPLATSEQGAAPPPEAAFQALMSSSRPQSLLRRGPGADSTRLVMLLPVVYRLTGTVEGAVMLSLPLQALLPQAQPQDRRFLTDASGRLLAGVRPDGPVLQSSAVLHLPPPLDQLGLVQSHARDRGMALRELNLMLVVFLVLGVALVVAVVLASRRAARWLATPLQALAATAGEIASTGRLNVLIETTRHDEYGRLSQAFNQMVERLRTLNEELEHRVEERTRALAASESRLQYVMDATGEGVWDWDLCSGNVSHNAQWCAMLGLDQSYLHHDLDAYLALLHPDDVETMQRAIQDSLTQGSPLNQEHRMVRPDGRVIWVLDRGKVVEYGADGQPQRMVGSLMDITDRKIATEEIRVRELYLRATLDNLPFLFWLKDADSRFLIVNSEFARACGQPSPEAVAGLTDLDIWPPDLAELYRADDRAVMFNGKEKALEEPVQSGDARTWIETYKKPVIAEDGTILGTVGFARDITGRKQIEQALEASEQRWQVAVSGSKDGIWDWNLASGEMFYSDQWLAMLGFGPGELPETREAWASRIHPADLERVSAELERHLRGETEYYQSEFRMRRKDGEYTWIQSRGQALFDDAGKPLRMAGSHTDISERRAAEAALRDRTEQMDAIFALSPDGFISFDLGRRIKYVNAAFLRMTGFSDAQLIGLEEGAFSQLLAGHCKPAMKFPGLESLRAELAQPQTGGSARVARRSLIELDTPRRTVLEVGLRLSLSDTVSQIMYFRDVTHETEVDQMKSEFLSTAAHELRTPMASILGFSELLLGKNFDADTQKELLQTIYKQSELMSSILNELLDLARIEARRGKDFVLKNLTLGGLLQEAVGAFSPAAGRAAPVLALCAEPTPVQADHKKMLQVINNVLSNAYKYSPEGGDVVVRELPRTQLQGRWMAGFSVQDHGIGMSPAQLARVCERFYRADTSGRIPGTGLGMSIVKEIVELHRGEVELDSVEGAGTTVRIWLPLAEA